MHGKRGRQKVRRRKKGRERGKRRVIMGGALEWSLKTWGVLWNMIQGARLWGPTAGI